MFIQQNVAGVMLLWAKLCTTPKKYVKDIYVMVEQSDASTRQGLPKISRKTPEGRNRFFFLASSFRRNQACQHLDLRLLVPKQ